MLKRVLNTGAVSLGAGSTSTSYYYKKGITAVFDNKIKKQADEPDVKQQVFEFVTFVKAGSAYEAEERMRAANQGHEKNIYFERKI